ncbi:MAG: FHIPEP family type III secretion protein [Victivallaceae bacterium]
MKKCFSLILIGVVGLVFFPLSPFLLDQLLCFSIAASVVLFAISLHIKDISSLTVYPSLFLYLTVMRVGLNFSSTRLILSQGNGSSVIMALGQFMVSESLISGFCIFFLIFVMNFILIAKGAERMAEVRSRFSLESLPGNQMSLDAEVISGKISSYQANKRREKIRQESDFYSSMEGTFKFIKGDALINVIILLVDFLGLIIHSGLSSNRISWRKFSFLILGDGIVGQIPLIFTSLGGAALISRIGKETSFIDDMLSQVKKYSDIFKLGAFAVLFLLIVPGMPCLPVLSAACLFLLIGFQCSVSNNEKSFGEVVLTLKNLSDMKDIKENYLSTVLRIKKNLGISFPKLRFERSDDIDSHAWELSICGKHLRTGSYCQKKDFFEAFESSLYCFAHELITGEYVEELLRDIGTRYGCLTDELIPKRFSRDCLKILLKCLVKERISLNLLPKILEILTVFQEKPVPEKMSEYVRRHLGSCVGKSVLGEYKNLRAVVLENSVERMIEASDRINPLLSEKILNEIETIFKKSPKEEESMDIVVTGVAVRSEMRKMMDRRFPDIPVLAYGEITDEVNLKKLGLVSDSVLI